MRRKGKNFMTRSEFIRTVAKSSGVTMKDTKKVLEAMEETIMLNMKKLIPIKAFKGITFKPRIKKGRECYNPKTLDKVVTEDKVVVKTVFSKTFNEAIN